MPAFTRLSPPHTPLSPPHSPPDPPGHTSLPPAEMGAASTISLLRAVKHTNQALQDEAMGLVQREKKVKVEPRNSATVNREYGKLEGEGEAR